MQKNGEVPDALSSDGNETALANNADEEGMQAPDRKIETIATSATGQPELADANQTYSKMEGKCKPCVSSEIRSSLLCS